MINFQKTQLDRFRQSGFLQAVAVPYLAVHLMLLLVTFLSPMLARNQRYIDMAFTERGWEINPVPALDVWFRWDSQWYLSIAKEGYKLSTDLEYHQSNLAFYPLYPYLVRILSLPAYGNLGTNGVLLVAGLIVSNAFLLAGLYMLRKLIEDHFHDRELANRTAQYLLFFPSAFIFSCFYTESTFLFFSVAAFFAARKGSWPLAGLAAALLSLTRPLGFLIAVPLGVIYMESRSWNFRKIRPDVLWLGLAPLALLGYMAALMPVTGDFFAIFRVQSAWEREFMLPWETIRQAFSPSSYAEYMDLFSTLAVLALSLVAMFKLPSISYGLFSLLLLLPVFFTGTLESVTRYTLTMFPVFVLLGVWGKRQWVHQTILCFFLPIQAVLFVAWARFYWLF